MINRSFLLRVPGDTWQRRKKYVHPVGRLNLLMEWHWMTSVPNALSAMLQLLLVPSAHL
jgi:hypothetical protein